MPKRRGGAPYNSLRSHREPTCGPTLSKASSSSVSACSDRGLCARCRVVQLTSSCAPRPFGLGGGPWWAALTVSTHAWLRCGPLFDAHPKMFTVPRPATEACFLRSSLSLAGLLSWGSSQRLPFRRHPTRESTPGSLPSPPGGVSSELDMQSLRLAPSRPPRLCCEPSAPECQSGTRSALAVSHDSGGLLLTRSAGLLHPAADHRVRLVAGNVSILDPHRPLDACTPCGEHVRAGQRPTLFTVDPKTGVRPVGIPPRCVPKHAARWVGDRAALHCWSDGSARPRSPPTGV